MQSPAPQSLSRYAFVGTGHRAEMFFAAMLDEYADVARPVALCDTNRTRIGYYQRLWSKHDPSAEPLPDYPAADFEAMLVAEQPDTVVVTSPDHTHAAYVAAALDHGCRVVTEKPLTIDADGCRRIVEAADAADRELVVTFNYRYSPRNSALRDLLTQGRIGEVTSVNFEWLLDTVHGADYFRRWHRRKQNSGGLLVHKASHHFDLVNWWLRDVPVEVYARGSLRVYGPNGAAVPRAEEFALDLAATPRLQALYGGAAAHDGYVRNGSVVDPEIDIEDNLTAIVRYREGALLTYALNAHAPWEGYRVAINGTRGRIELEVVERASVRSAPDVLDPSVTPDTAATGPRTPGTRLLLQEHWRPAVEIPVDEGSSAHGGGDALLLRDVFSRPHPDPLGRRADYRDGVRSVLVGIAANESLRTGLPVSLASLGVPERAYATTPQEN